jgi:hypothetical protein
MILYEDRLTHILDRPGYEQDVRARMEKEGINHEQCPYLVPKPFPEPEYMRLWFKEQFGHASDSYKLWHGWIMLKHESDGLLVFLTWGQDK